MIKFKEINDGLTCVTGLTSELESLYINDVYNKKRFKCFSRYK